MATKTQAKQLLDNRHKRPERRKLIAILGSRSVTTVQSIKAYVIEVADEQQIDLKREGFNVY